MFGYIAVRVTTDKARTFRWEVCPVPLGDKPPVATYRGWRANSPRVDERSSGPITSS